MLTGDLLPCLVLAAVLTWQGYQHERERGQWAQERAALLQRCVLGLAIGPPPVVPPLRSPGDVGEWETEQARGRATEGVG